MVSQYSELTQLKHAKQIARDHGCFVVEIPYTDKNGDRATKYLLYREAQPRNVLVGKRMNVGTLLAFVKKACAFV